MTRSSFQAPKSPWWDRSRHEDRRPFLLARNRIKQAIRAWFTNNGYIEVDTGCLQVSPGNETHLHAFATSLKTPQGSTKPYYLHTSPEFACKKLLAAGETKIFTFAPVFRNRERGSLHHPEFTMLEWYETDVPYDKLINDCSELLKVAAGETEHARWTYGETSANPTSLPERLSVAEAFQKFANTDVLSTIDNDIGNRSKLADAAQHIGVRIASDDTWSDIFSRIMVEKIEPYLGHQQPTALHSYPIIEAALARPSSTDPRLAERFELYCCGIELANAFGELTNATIQSERFKTDMDEKQRIYGERYPIDEEFLYALTHMPSASGCALGFDRLVMLATGARSVEDVIWTPMPSDD